MTEYEEQTQRLTQIGDDAESCAGRLCAAATAAETELGNIQLKDATAQQLITAMQNRMNAVDDESLIAEVSFLESSKTTPPNMLKWGGTFSEKTSLTGDTSNVFIDESGILSSYNGSTFHFSSNFIHNNSTYGGGSNVLLPSMIALMNKLSSVGRDVLRYGVTFNEARINAGTGTLSTRNVSGKTFYRMCGASSKMMSNLMTVAYWLRVAGNPIAVDCAKIDGVWSNNKKNRTVVLESGVYHIVSFIERVNGYERLLALFGTNDVANGGDYSRAYISMPYVCVGLHNVLPENHLSPIPSAYLMEVI